MELFTEKLLLKDIDFAFPIKDLVNEILKDPTVPYRKEGEIPFYRRYGVQEKAVTAGLKEGQVRHWISTVTLDTYGEVMLPRGAQLKYYKKNPIVLWGHNSREPENVMGTNIELEVTDNGLMALTEFAMMEEKAARVYRLYKNRHLRMWSVGFIPIKGSKPEPEKPKKDSDLEKLYEYIPSPEKVNWIHEKWRLLEYSAVPVGANPDALTVAIKSAGWPDDLVLECQRFSQGLLEMIGESRTVVDLGGLKKDDQEEQESEEEEKKEDETEGEKEFVYDPDEEGLEWDSGEGVDSETFRREYEEGKEISDEEAARPYPNEHACRLREPGDFQEGSFRSYERTAANGKVYRVIAGRLKGKKTMTEQAFRYAKDTWSANDARKHCKDHKGILFEPAAGKEVDLEEPEKNKSLQILAGEIKELRELVEQREGQVLSSKNRQIIKGAVEAMRIAVEKLEELLEATEKPKTEAEEEAKEDESEFVMELTGEEEEFKEKKEDEVLLTLVEEKKDDMKDRLDFGKVFRKELSKARGEVR